MANSQAGFPGTQDAGKKQSRQTQRKPHGQYRVNAIKTKRRLVKNGLSCKSYLVTSLSAEALLLLSLHVVYLEAGWWDRERLITLSLTLKRKKKIGKKI